MLLPIHRLFKITSSKAGLFFCLIKFPSFLRILSKFIIWIVLACVAIAFIWFEGLRLTNSESLTQASGFESYPAPTNDLEGLQAERVWESRKNEVRNAVKHAWSGYKSIAYPNDELLPLSGGTSNKLRSSSLFL